VNLERIKVAPCWQKAQYRSCERDRVSFSVLRLPLPPATTARTPHLSPAGPPPGRFRKTDYSGKRTYWPINTPFLSLQKCCCSDNNFLIDPKLSGTPNEIVTETDSVWSEACERVGNAVISHCFASCLASLVQYLMSEARRMESGSPFCLHVLRQPAMAHTRCLAFCGSPNPSHASYFNDFA